MKPTASHMRRTLAGVFATCAVGAAGLMSPIAPLAAAAPDPCAASSIARTIGTVSDDAADYLEDHPETDAAVSMAAQQPGPQAFAMLKMYFDANPEAAKDLQKIQQPLSDLSGRCQLPITLPQALQMLQGLGQGGGLPGGTALPVGLPVSPAFPQTTVPDSSAGAVPGSVPGAGPLPGPSTTVVPGTTGTLS